MSKIYFLGDPHINDPAVVRFRHRLISTIEENTSLIIDDWKATVKKRDTVFVMGDVAYNQEGLDLFRDLPGRKILIRGNHDDLPTKSYIEVFDEIESMVSYKKMWLTHCPIHPQEFFEKKLNLHGHVHGQSVRKLYRESRDEGENILDERYLNVCPEIIYPLLGTNFLSLDFIRENIITS